MPRSYSQAQLNEAASEVDALRVGSMIEEMLADYRDLRRQSIACEVQ